jgi:NitT/TauT family transport system substrate-binding protein
MARQRTRTLLFACLVPTVLVAAACGGDDGDSSATSTSGDPTPDVSTSSDPGVVAPLISEERCAANRAAGTITYLTGFDFAAAASIVEVVVAEHEGYFDQMCLDVELKPSFSTANYPLVSANQAQFSSAGNFTEVAQYAQQNAADLVVLSVDGRTAIDVLIAKPDDVTDYEDLRGETIGVKGKLPSSIKALLAKHGLVEGSDYDTVLIEGFDPKVHLDLPGIVAFPGWKSNEPGQLERAGASFNTFDPTEEGIPGSFGLIYTNRQFLDEHRSAAEDFMRAAMKGLEFAMADPAAAAAICVEAINANGNKNFLSPEGETYRWETEAALIAELTPDGVPYGLPDVAALAAEVAAYDEVGAFGDAGSPPTDGRVDASVLEAIYADDGTVIWGS